jgi:HK97 family phage prohead protease
MKDKVAVEKLLPIIEERFNVKFENISGTVIRKSLETDQLVIDENDKDCVIAKLSTIDPDRVGDVLIPDGCDLSDYERNPVVLVSHDYSKLPIAKMVKIQKTDKAVYGKMQFSETDEAQDVLKLIREGILKTCSVGFVAKNTLKRGTKAFIDYIKQKFNGVDTNVKQIITDWKMLELSLVSIPCNSEALVVAVSKGLTISEKTQKLLNIEEAFIKGCQHNEEDEEDEEYIDKPYPNEHAVRLNQPSKYVRFARKNDEMGSGIDAIYGITEDGTTELQALRFDSTKYTITEVRNWIKEHDMNPISIEEASGKTEEKSLENDNKPQDIVVDIPKTDENKETITENIQHIVENVQEIKEEVTEIIEDSKEIIESVVQEVKPVVDRFIRLVSKPEEEIKKELQEHFIKRKSGKLF